eukprot:7389610-Prymnesium_polylepis.1
MPSFAQPREIRSLLKASSHGPFAQRSTSPSVSLLAVSRSCREGTRGAVSPGKGLLHLFASEGWLEVRTIFKVLVLIVLTAVTVANTSSHTLRSRGPKPLNRDVRLEPIPKNNVVGVVDCRLAAQSCLGVISAIRECREHNVVKDGRHRRELHATAVRLDEPRLPLPPRDFVGQRAHRSDSIKVNLLRQA